MKTVRWQLTIGYPSADRDGEFEVEDDATADEIEAIVRDEVFNFIEWSWSKSDSDDAAPIPSQHPRALEE